MIIGSEHSFECGQLSDYHKMVAIDQITNTNDKYKCIKRLNDFEKDII